MSVVYVNNFDHLQHHGKPSDGDVTASLAAYDPPILIPQTPITFLGPMICGASDPPPGTVTVETSPVAIGAPPHQVTVIDGTTVTLTNAAANAAKSFYVVAENKVLLSRGSVFEAELVFDKPMATLSGAPGKPWAVALNFKTGDASDQATDGRAGVTCQFNDNGYIKFHFTDSMWGGGPVAATYADYAGTPLTEFRLTVAISVVQGAIVGTGSIRYDDNFYGGNLVAAAGAVLPDPTQLTAVGVALTNTKGGFSDFGVRLRSFTLSVM